jgi:hypothetical protein
MQLFSVRHGLQPAPAEITFRHEARITCAMSSLISTLRMDCVRCLSAHSCGIPCFRESGVNSINAVLVRHHVTLAMHGRQRQRNARGPQNLSTHPVDQRVEPVRIKIKSVIREGLN